MLNFNKTISTSKIARTSVVTTLVMFLWSFGLYAQNTVRGTITGDGEALPGVNVLIQGTNQGTTTDVDGNYSLAVPSEATTLIYSFVGYTSQVIAIGNRSVIDILMEEDISALEEIVVTGYGTVKKSDLTGSIAQVKGDALNEFPIASLDQGIQGRAPGIFVQQASSAPGGGTRVRIRGNNSLNIGSEPLYVVDGFPTYPDNASSGVGGNHQPTSILATINPADIESIEILKDAAATAIYGSRGSNGVVLITTKRGKEGNVQVELNSAFSASEVANQLDVLNAEEYADFQNLRAASRDIPPPYNPADFRGTGVNWQDELFQTGAIQNHQLSVSGGDKASQFMVSLGYFDNEGIVQGSEFTRYSVRANFDTKFINDKVTLSTSNMISRTETNNVTTDNGGTRGLITETIGGEPFGPVKDENGEFVRFLYDGRFLVNPLAEITLGADDDKGTRILSNTSLGIDIWKGLKFKGSVGFDIYDVRRRTYYGLGTHRGDNDDVSLSEATRSIVSFLSENIFTYDFDVNDHTFNVLAGYTFQTELNEFFSASNSDFPFDDPDANTLGDGGAPGTPSSSRGEWDLMSFIGRVNYNYKGKYLLSASVRRDGSSRFGENNKWATFPSVAVGWRIIEEDFMGGQGLFSDLKLRLSYGETGNSNIPLYRSLPGLSLGNYSFNNVPTPAVRESSLQNDDLKWETTQMTNFGLDVGFLQGRLNLTMDYFVTKTDDMLLNVTLPASIGFSSAFINAGSLENKGFELGINFEAIESDNFKWDIGGVLSILDNEITSLGPSAPFHGPTVSSHQGIRGPWTAAGLPIGNWKGMNAIGIWQNQGEIDSNPSFAFDKPGYVRYADTNGDGELNSDDEVIVGDPNPDFSWGLTNNFTFRRFDATLFFRGVQGNDVRNAQAAEAADGIGNYNQLAYAYRDAWSTSNPTGTRPVIDATREFANHFRNSSFFIEDGSFIRLQNVAIGYTFPTVGFIRSARLYISGQNLFMSTDYLGFDPEVSAEGQSNLAIGDDYDAYPRARTYTIGFNLKF